MLCSWMRKIIIILLIIKCGGCNSDFSGRHMMLAPWAASRTSRVPSLWLGMLWSTLNTPSWWAMMVGLSLSLSQYNQEYISILCTLGIIIVINFFHHTATDFATQMGFPVDDLHTNYSW